jgi:hypothetical protein
MCSSQAGPQPVGAMMVMMMSLFGFLNKHMVHVVVLQSSPPPSLVARARLCLPFSPISIALLAHDSSSKVVTITSGPFADSKFLMLTRLTFPNFTVALITKKQRTRSRCRQYPACTVL